MSQETNIGGKKEKNTGPKCAMILGAELQKEQLGSMVFLNKK